MEGKKDLQSQRRLPCAGICVEHGICDTVTCCSGEMAELALAQMDHGQGLTSTSAAGTAHTLLQSWQVYCRSFGHSPVAPLKLGSCMRMRGPAQPRPAAGGNAMLHTGASSASGLGFQGCSQLRRSSLCNVILLPRLLASSAPSQKLWVQSHRLSAFVRCSPSATSYDCMQAVLKYSFTGKVPYQVLLDATSWPLVFCCLMCCWHCLQRRPALKAVHSASAHDCVPPCSRCSCQR